MFSFPQQSSLREMIVSIDLFLWIVHFTCFAPLHITITTQNIKIYVKKQKQTYMYDHIFIVVVGFEREIYSVNEFTGALEVCVVVINPPVGHTLNETIVLNYSTRFESAGDNKAFVYIILYNLFVYMHVCLSVYMHVCLPACLYV